MKAIEHQARYSCSLTKTGRNNIWLSQLELTLQNFFDKYKELHWKEEM